MRPTNEGILEVEYWLELLHTRTAERMNVTLFGKVYPDGEGEGEYRRLLERLQGREHLFGASNLFGFAHYTPELRLLLHAPLADEKMPGLPLALDPEAMEPFLERYLAASAPRQARVRTCAVEILRYKPGKRCILRYRLDTGPRSVIGKIYGEGQDGEGIFATMAELARRGFGREAADGIKIPHPYGYIGELQMLLLEDVSGAPLRQMLSSPRRGTHLQAAARALAKIHRCSLKVSRTYAPEDRVLTLKRGVAKAIQVCPDLAAAFEQSLDGAVALARTLPSPERVLVHRDFQHNHVLLSDNVVTILDFDSVCNGDPALDVGNFLGHLRWRGVQLEWPEAEARRHAETFLEAYGAEISPELKGRIDFYYRASLLRLACLVSLRPARRHFAAALLDEAMSDYDPTQEE